MTKTLATAATATTAATAAAAVKACRHLAKKDLLEKTKKCYNLLTKFT
jgi:hypothetical protein